MALEIRVLKSIEQTNRNQWNHVVETAPHGSLFHRYEWLQAVEDGTDREPRHLVASKKGNPVGVFPNVITSIGPVKRLDSLYPGFGGPLAITDEETVLETFLEVVPEICDGRTLFNRIRTYDQAAIRNHALFREFGYEIDVKWCRVALDLTQGWESLLEGMDRTRRRGIKRGHDQSLEISEEPVTVRSLSQFYEDYEAVMTRADLPVLSHTFFMALRHLANRLKLFAIDIDGVRRGWMLCYCDDEQSTLHYAYSGVRSEHFEYHASELLHEHAIRWGIEHGYETYDLLRTPPDFRDGLFNFKTQFGGQTVPLLSWERGVPKPALPALKLARTIAAK